jgi:hypothetical protein
VVANAPRRGASSPPQNFPIDKTGGTKGRAEEAHPGPNLSALYPRPSSLIHPFHPSNISHTQPQGEKNPLHPSPAILSRPPPAGSILSRHHRPSCYQSIARAHRARFQRRDAKTHTYDGTLLSFHCKSSPKLQPQIILVNSGTSRMRFLQTLHMRFFWGARGG